MNKLIYIAVFVVSLVLGSVLSCEADCPRTPNHSRGVFPIEAGYGDAPDNGTIEVGETQVEILYRDVNGNDWRALYKITKEE